MSSLEDLCIAAYLGSICKAAAVLRRRRSEEHIAALRHHARDSLAESLGGVSSVNVRTKMLARLRDVPFLVRVGQPYIRLGRPLAAAVNQAFVDMFCCILSPDLHGLGLSCKIMSSDLQDFEDELIYDDSSPYMEDPSAEFHLNLGEIVRQLTTLYRAEGPAPRLQTIDLQGCYIGRMHGGLQLALTRLFDAPGPARFHQLTSLTLRDFLEPHGTPSKRVISRVRLCKAVGTACERLEYLNLGNIDVGAVVHIFVVSTAKAFPATAKTDHGPVLVAAEGQAAGSVSIEESINIEPSLLHPLCSTLKTLVLSLRDQTGTYCGLSLAPFFVERLGRLEVLHLDGVDNVVVGGLAMVNQIRNKQGVEKDEVVTTNITSADWFNPDRSRFYRQLGLEETFTFQDGIDLLCQRCPHLRRLTLGKSLLLEYRSPIWIPREPFSCSSLQPLHGLTRLRSLTTQCIPAKYIVPVIKAIGKQLEVLNIRLHMQTSGGLSCGFIEEYVKHLDYNIQITGQPLTRGDFLRQEAWLEGGQEAIDKIEPYIRDHRLDAVFVDDY